MIPSQNRIEISVKEDTSVLLVIKGLRQMSDYSLWTTLPIYIGRELFNCFFVLGDLIETRPTTKEDATTTKVTYAAHF